MNQFNSEMATGHTFICFMRNQIDIWGWQVWYTKLFRFLGGDQYASRIWPPEGNARMHLHYCPISGTGKAAQNPHKLPAPAIKWQTTDSGRSNLLAWKQSLLHYTSIFLWRNFATCSNPIKQGVKFPICGFCGEKVTPYFEGKYWNWHTQNSNHRFLQVPTK